MNGIVYPYGSSHLIDTSDKYYTTVNGVDKVKIPGNNEIPATTLIQLSGGVDSAYVLWKWLVENPNEYCLVHHIKLMNYEKRHDNELIAVDKILRWLDSKGLKNYFYVQNTFDYGNFTSVITDSEMCGFNAGILLRGSRWSSINKILLPIYNVDLRRSKMQKGGREHNRLEIMRATSKRDDYEVVYPLINMSKSDVVRAIPKDLLDLCWYCRVPLNGEKCGTCFTCKEVDKSFEKIKNDNLLDFIMQVESQNKKES
jgi:7-cyano-7-deazaguanine synthase in queuosine biosynthesis